MKLKHENINFFQTMLIQMKCVKIQVFKNAKNYLKLKNSLKLKKQSLKRYRNIISCLNWAPTNWRRFFLFCRSSVGDKILMHIRPACKPATPAASSRLRRNNGNSNTWHLDQYCLRKGSLRAFNYSFRIYISEKLALGPKKQVVSSNEKQSLSKVDFRS